jgi:hypothetical protein
MPVTVTARLRREQAEQHISDPQRLCALALDTDAGQRDGLPQEAIRPGLHLAPRRSRSPRSARCNPGGEAVGLHAGQPPAAGGPSQIVDVWGRPDVESIPHLQRAAQQRVEESSVVTGEVRDG